LPLDLTPEKLLSITNNKIIILIQDLLIRVKAASVNPLDVLMSQGYGFSLFELMKSRSVENFSTFNPFPITLGRDFSGVVVDKGMDVGDLQVGDQVRKKTINFM
jgi:NADPH:quinone reductase-like Zn-dependent oxidoreductase